MIVPCDARPHIFKDEHGCWNVIPRLANGSKPMSYSKTWEEVELKHLDAVLFCLRINAKDVKNVLCTG